MASTGHKQSVKTRTEKQPCIACIAYCACVDRVDALDVFAFVLSC